MSLIAGGALALRDWVLIGVWATLDESLMRCWLILALVVVEVCLPLLALLVDVS